jgi:hypothetical protein
MNSETRARAGRYKEVPYFNGGIFGVIDPVELNSGDVLQLRQAANENWATVQPAIFGTLFQHSTEAGERHAFGAHFTSEADIYKVVRPTILDPIRRRIRSAKTFQPGFPLWLPGHHRLYVPPPPLERCLSSFSS